MRFKKPSRRPKSSIVHADDALQKLTRCEHRADITALTQRRKGLHTFGNA